MPSTAASWAVCHALKPVGGLALLSTLFEVQPGGIAFPYQFLHNWKHLCLKVERCLQASWKTILQRMFLCFTLLAFYQMVSVDPPPHCTEFLYNRLWSNLLRFCFCSKGMVLTSCTAGTSQQKHDPKIWKMFWYSPLLGLSANWSLAFIFMFEISA